MSGTDVLTLSLRMKTMGRPLLALAALFVVAFSSEEYKQWCHDQTCPYYQLIARNAEFEERSYVATVWISTNIESAEPQDVTAAYERLKSFCGNNGEAGYNMSHTWPALISESESGLGFMQWFVPPGTVVPADLPPSITVVSRPEANIYVRVFDGIPSQENGKSNSGRLCSDLDQAHKSYNHSEYIGAGFDSFFSLTHHNEIWIRTV